MSVAVLCASPAVEELFALREVASVCREAGRLLGPLLCARGRVPVFGLPLDANRCARWLGDFYPNTASLARLEALLAGR